ncbi:hypothetical protein SZN_25939 [Streptomyces zinciresistens K42]|uniref:Secreted protein n=1 Tax=Streptomyces zinciresistens K42 TaxID=700597 RepID=G2GI48_9ACTN|nr:hypothetical protein [Streptomyces zinciresistens]EGX56815.1 hypothetical protein SZN_25939 [Streptomyces zinciresistens K42]
MTRDHRSASWTGAVLVMLLAALMHVLACSHGPASAAAMGADTPLSVTAACGSPSERPGPGVDRPAPSDDSDMHCQGVDQSTMQPSRDVAPTLPVVHDVLPADRTPIRWLSARPPDSTPLPGRSSHGNARALIGVWRT